MTIIFGKHDNNTLKQLEMVSKNADRVSLMADGHLGYIMPIGGVAGYKNKISPSGVGFDIACGNMAIKLDVKINEINIDKILDEIESKIIFGTGGINHNSPKDHELFESEKWASYGDKHLISNLKDLARKQLGTAGSGNHYVDIFKDKEEFVWVGVHFGSRGLGHKTANGFMALSQNGDIFSKPKQIETLLDMNSEIGQRYYDAMLLCGEYAYAGREWVCDTVQNIIGANRIYSVHNHHNFAWKETHDNQELYVIRKGATPCFPGQEGFVGGSMGDDAVIIEGIDLKRSKDSLYSTIHGAGRVMSRSEASGKQKWIKGPDGKKRPHRVTDGKISRDMMNKWIKNKNVKLRGGGCDESPHAYKRLENVLKEHEGTIKVNHVLSPVGVVMA